jgi:sugar phosphate permease
MLVSVSAAFRTMTQVGLLTFLPVYLAYELDYSPFVVGACMTLMQVAGFVAGPIGGHLSDRMGRRRVVASSMTLSAVVIAGMALAGTSVLFVVFIALVGFFLYAMRPVVQAWAIESTPKHLAGTGVGLQFGIQAIGASIAPAIFGMIADAHGSFAAFYFLAGTILCANFLIFFMPNGEPTEPATAPAKAG